MGSLALPILYNRVPKAQQDLILRFDLPATARRVVLASRRVESATGVFYVGVLTWEIPRGGTRFTGAAWANDPHAEADVTSFTKHLGRSAVDWHGEAFA